MSVDDKAIITVQLGREPRGLRRVVSRCAHGCPQIIENNTFTEDGRPFPTLYWLTCPLMVKAVSRFEDDGWAERLQEEISRDRLLRDKLCAAHEDYQLLRRKKAEDTEHPVLETGVGGVRDLNAVKCLHAHYAHYLATGKNPIGRMVDDKLTGLECETRCDVP